MDRITERDLNTLVDQINTLTNSPQRYMIDSVIQVGHYHVSHAYGGVCLHRTVNAGGGVRCPLGMGHGTKRELYSELRAFIAGLETK